jgi:perosamine synthetase
MRKALIEFARPYFSDKDIEEINRRTKRILKSGWLTSGPTVKEFENFFTNFIGTKYAIAVNSCTAALHIGLLTLKIKSGDEVIVPANTFVATANAVLYVGAKPVFADSDPNTFNISPTEVQNKISTKTRAIIVVHLAGNPCDMAEIMKIADDKNIPVIEDCAHALGSKYRGKSCGGIGKIGCFSFYPTKIITTSEGGVITTNSDVIAEKARQIRNHGRASFGPSEITELGFNYRLSEIHAALGLSQIKHIHSFIRQRNKIAEAYNRELRKIKWLQPQRVNEGNFCSYYAYILKVKKGAPITRDGLRNILEKRGIMTSVLYHPVHLQPFYVKLFNQSKAQLPVAEDLGANSLALPIYNGMKIKDANRVIEAVKEESKNILNFNREAFCCHYKPRSWYSGLEGRRLTSDDTKVM